MKLFNAPVIDLFVICTMHLRKIFCRPLKLPNVLVTYYVVCTEEGVQEILTRHWNSSILGFHMEWGPILISLKLPPPPPYATAEPTVSLPSIPVLPICSCLIIQLVVWLFADILDWPMKAPNNANLAMAKQWLPLEVLPPSDPHPSSRQSLCFLVPTVYCHQRGREFGGVTRS